ncbi:hypothetical protein A5893_05260 [Pedobacter psychrophilus]|uniref:Uncharacterized protein n=2 Tax=Pedobacter psychrophilus TaxID=1826909 RepID=A0A179DH67_9SPHI|nr:hypothetical protein A5893_05260 [Pedobacter psychrophilus]
MRKRNNLLFQTIIVFMMMLSLKVTAQEYQFIAKIDTAAKMVNLDNLGNLFVVTPKNELLKFNPQGKFLWNYTNKTFGDISQIDVTDPLRVILYYEGYQQIVVLNNNLSEISKFTFNQNPNQQITLVASANNNGFWVYDQINRELRKLTNNFIDDLNSGNIYQRNGFDMQANFMLTDDQYIYINDKKEGIRIFDRFGNFFKTAIIFPKNNFEVNDNDIYFMKDSTFMKYNINTYHLSKIDLPIQETFIDASLRFSRLVILKENDITLWAVKND